MTEAADGEEAVELFEVGSYDLVVMDIIMPLMDGVDAINAIRKLESGKTVTPILALTVERSVETGLDCLSAGADRMLLKPVARMGLLRTVCDLLDIPESVAT